MDTNSSLITIGIPFYNDEEFLDFAVKSVFEQTYTNWNLILMDDGSCDGSLNIAEKYKDDPRVKIYSDGNNKNLPFRLNQIAKLSTTKYLARMDSDDIMHPERLKTQIRILEENPQIDVLGTNAVIIDKDNIVYGIRFKDEPKEVLSTTTVFIHPSIMGKSSWFKNNPYNEDAIRIEDKELWYRKEKNSNFYYLNTPLLYYREFDSNYYKKYGKGIKSYIRLSANYFSNKKYKDSKVWLGKGIYSIIKYLSYFIFSKLNQEQRLITRRNLPLTKEKITEYNNTIEKILYFDKNK